MRQIAWWFSLAANYFWQPCVNTKKSCPCWLWRHKCSNSAKFTLTVASHGVNKERGAFFIKLLLYEKFCSLTDGCNWLRKDSDGVPRSSVTLFHWSISDELVKELWNPESHKILQSYIYMHIILYHRTYTGLYPGISVVHIQKFWKDLLLVTEWHFDNLSASHLKWLNHQNNPRPEDHLIWWQYYVVLV